MSNHTTSNKVVDGIDRVKNAFISGEPGTTGREPFEHSTASGPGANFATGPSSGTHSGTGLTGDHSHSHSSGTGLTGSADRSHPTQNPSATGGAINTGLTGPGHHETGAAAGLHAPHKDQHQSNAQTSSAGNGAVGISGVGLDGLSRTAADKTTGYTGPNHNVDHNDREFRGTDNKGLMDKVKDALPGSNKDSTSSHSHSAHDNSHSHSSTTGTGLAGSHSNTHGTAGPEKRGIVDKINDALPGTPAKTEQHYGESHNPTTLPDHTSRHGAGTAYGAGPHGTSGVTDEAGSHAFPGSDRHEKDVIGGHHSGATGATHREHGDRVGAQGQDSSKYEGNLNSGPRTSGAAGTDRFDSSHTGAPGNVGAGLDRQHDDGVHHDTSQRAPGKSSGGIGGVLATSDKDFTGRERQGQGAYADTDGLYKNNTTGPAGNSALTGREGNLDNNPVAQAKSREAGSTTTGTTNTHATEEHGEKKGLMAKVKDAFSS